jgi:hypothetical protein
MAEWNISPQVEKQLEGMARDEAQLSQEGHSYLPNTPEEAAGFTPHAWVLEAMRRAYSMGRGAGRSAAKEEIRAALGLH